MKRFQHNDLASLEGARLVRQSAGKLVVVDGVYSMGGDIAPCRDHRAVQRYGAADGGRCHSIGVLGESGHCRSLQGDQDVD